jgi:hypothetical protein
MFLTHFGPSGDVRNHLQLLIENLTSAAEWVRRSLLEPGTDDEKAGRYGAPFEVSWQGLADSP